MWTNWIINFKIKEKNKCIGKLIKLKSKNKKNGTEEKELKLIIKVRKDRSNK